MRSLSQVCFAIALVATLFADAHELRAQVLGNQVFEPDSFRQVASDINVGLPGRLWFRSTYADQGLGYEGSYITVGAKGRLFEDSWDGRWLSEARVHYSLEEDGGFFANIGIERVFSLEAAKADLVGGIWYDYDGDDQGAFANDFSQVSVNAAIKTRKWDLIGNGYFPVGVTDFTTAGEDGNNVFFGSSLLLTPGVNSALRGFDVTLRTRPKYLSFGNGIFDFGGYGYSSDTIDFFSGGRARLGFQLRNGAMIAAEVNHDDRFNTTGSLGLSWNFGASGAAGNNGRGIGADLAETVRNDHIVRFTDGFVAAIDPETGLAYNVLHVNNTADPAFGDGTFETPFASLAAAEAASMEGDIIFVDAGDGSRQGLDTGFVLQDRQQFLGGGGPSLIPIQDGTLFQIPGTGPRPTISNPGAQNVITLANDNVIRNVNIDATGAQNGIAGFGVTEGVIEDTNVTGASQNGVSLNTIAGDWAFRRTVFNNNINDGLFITNTTDNSSVFTIEDVVASGNGFEGINFENFRGTQLSVVNTTTSGNGRHGLYVQDFIGEGLDVDLINHTANNNGGTGVFFDGGDGDLNIINANITGNAVNGLHVLNWSNAVAGDTTFIGNSEGGITNIGGNQSTNIVIEIDDVNTVQDVLITGLSVLGGGRGLFASAAGQGSVLNINVVDNVEFSQHLTDGLRFEANDSGTLNVLVENETDQLVLNDNGQTAGASIAFFADAPLGQPTSNLNATVRNVSINNDGEAGFVTTVIGNFGPDGISVDGTGTSRINLLVEDSRIESAGGIDVELDNNGNGDVNNLFFRNLTIRSDVGVFLNTQGGTFLDFALLDSNIQSNGNIRQDGVDAMGVPFTNDPLDQPEVGDPFLDFVGNIGFFANVSGDFGGALDNLTRINFSNNLVRDFTFEAFQVNTFGDAQLLTTLDSNQFLRNGPGLDDVIEFPIDNPMTTTMDFATVNENEANFLDAVTFNAFDNSLVSLRANANSLVNNYEAGINLFTSDTATINASINFNNFANDIGQDMDATAVNIATSFITEFAATNTGFGTMCLALSSNTFRAGADFNQFSANQFIVELDGATNGFTDAALFPGIVTGTVGVCEGLISDEELFFAASGGVDAATPPGGGFAIAP